MAPLSAAPRLEKERRLNTLISFASDLQAQLSTPAARISQTSIDELEKHTVSFPSNLALIATTKYEDLDSNGTALWNLCTRLKRNNESGTPHIKPEVILVARVFAFLLLDCAQSSGKGSYANLVRIMKVGLKTAKACIDLKHLDLSFKVLEKVAGYEENMKNPKEEMTPEDVQINQRLSSEYFVVRTTLAWHQDRIEVAEHMFVNAALSRRQLDANTAESLADVLFEMGRDLLGKNRLEMAVKWLDRAQDVLVSQDIEKLSPDGSELRISIIQCTIRALLGLQQQTSFAKASNMVELLENEIGDKLIVLLMKLELISSSVNEVFDHDAYNDVLRNMVRTVILTESTFKLIMHHIRKLNDKNPSMACDRLDEFLNTRVFQAEKEDWTESVLINRLWMATSQGENSEVLKSVETLLTTIISNTNRPISSRAMHAAHTLLWKRIETNYAQCQYDSAESWCHLALHQVFQNSGDLNKAKISRKLLLCALARQDIGSAQDIFSSMSEAAKDNPLTRFLMYKIAIRGGEVEIAAECLDKVYEQSSESSTILYACVLDAQQAGDKKQAIAALQLVLQKHEYNTPSTIHLPALLRCTIRLVLAEFEVDTQRSEANMISMVGQLCKLFDGAAMHATRSHAPAHNGENLFSIKELDWFSKNSYNLALKYSEEWSPKNILSLVQACIKFIDLYPKDVNEQLLDDLSLRRMFCDFLATILLIALARAEDAIEVQLQHYLIIRRHVESYDNLLQQKLEKMEEAPAQDLLKKLSMLLAYDFEAAVRLKAWDDLGSIVIKSETCKNGKIYELMADCILSSEAPTNVVIPALKKIINGAWSLDNFDSRKLSRYMRSLFQYALPQNNTIAEDLLEQIENLAHEAQESDQPYPGEELEWIATTSFNQAVDFYCTGQDDLCRRWAGRAINIASLCPDQGALHGVLEEKFFGLSWGNS